jgi:WD40 repeat protein
MQSVTPSPLRFVARRTIGAREDTLGQLCHPHFIRRLCVTRRLSTHRGCVNTVTWTEDARFAITGSDDTTLALWDTVSWNQRAKWSSLHRANVFCSKLLGPALIAGSSIASCALDGAVRLHTVASDRVVTGSVLHIHRGAAHKLAILSSSCFEFLTAGEDGVVAHIDIRARPSAISTVRARKQGSIHAGRPSLYFVDVFNDYFITGGDSSLALVYDMRRSASPLLEVVPTSLRSKRSEYCVTGGQWRNDGLEFVLTYNDAFAATIAFDHSSLGTPQKLLLSAAASPTDDACSASCHAHSESAVTVASHSRSEKFAAADADEVSVRRRDATSMGHHRQAGSTGVSAEGTLHAASTEVDPCAIFRHHKNRITIKSITYMGARGEWIVSGCDSGNVVFYRRSDGAVRHYFLGDRRGAVNCLSPHPHHLPVLLTSGLEKDAMVWTPLAPAVVAPGALSSWCASHRRPSISSASEEEGSSSNDECLSPDELSAAHSESAPSSSESSDDESGSGSSTTGTGRSGGEEAASDASGLSRSYSSLDVAEVPHANSRVDTGDFTASANTSDDSIGSSNEYFSEDDRVEIDEDAIQVCVHGHLLDEI